MRHLLFLSLIALFSSPALAIVKCDIDGKVTYSDTACPNGKGSEVSVPEVTTGSARQAQQQAARDKQEATRLTKSRHQSEQQDAKIALQSARRSASLRRGCERLKQQIKWREEDVLHARPQSRERAKRSLQRTREKYALDCKPAGA